MKRIITLCTFILLVGKIDAQQYQTAIGGRLGFFSGFSAKRFINDQHALEGLMSFRWTGFVFTGLYEYQQPMRDIENLDWFVGGGGHIGFWADGYKYDDHYYESGGNLGIDLIGGFEYHFKTAPITLGIDLKPAFNIVGHNHWRGNGFGITVRYILK
jgi:hypothetical protein